MGKTTLITQLLASFASAAFIVGYSTAEAAELVAFGAVPISTSIGQGEDRIPRMATGESAPPLNQVSTREARQISL